MEDTYQTIQVEKEEGVAWLYLNRPEKKNAMNPTMHKELKQALDLLEEDETVRVLVITGRGDSFCSGLDVIESFVNTYDEPEMFYKALYNVSSIAGWNLKLRYFPKPTIAAVNGYCLAGGFNLLSACDLAIASEKALFGLSEINFAHIPAGGSTWSAAEFLLPKHALYLILTGATIDGKEAARIGLVNQAVPHEQLIPKTNELANILKAKHPIALRSAKWNYLLTRRLGADLLNAIQWELAMLHENTFFTKAEWIRVALQNYFC
ncbi:MAG: enoyl-CoA hydratase-related protein [Nitrososphaerales archaeon]